MTIGTAPSRRLRLRSEGTVTGLDAGGRAHCGHLAPAARLGPAGWILPHQVVPGTLRAHLDLVTEHRLGPPAQLR